MGHISQRWTLFEHYKSSFTFETWYQGDIHSNQPNVSNKTFSKPPVQRQLYWTVSTDKKSRCSCLEEKTFKNLLASQMERLITHKTEKVTMCAPTQSSQFFRLLNNCSIAPKNCSAGSKYSVALDFRVWKYFLKHLFASELGKIIWNLNFCLIIKSL